MFPTSPLLLEIPFLTPISLGKKQHRSETDDPTAAFREHSQSIG